MMGVLRNSRHEAFARELSKGSSASEAYRNAGYRPNRGAASRLQHDSSILQRVAEMHALDAEMVKEATERATQALAIDREWVLGKLMENVERSMQARPVRDGDGNASGEYRYDGSVANRALELLGKELGMFVDRSENVNTNFTVSDQPMSEEEWAATHCTEH